MGGGGTGGAGVGGGLHKSAESHFATHFFPVFSLHFLSSSTAAGGISLLPRAVLTQRICMVAGFRQLSRLSFIIIGKERVEM